MLCTFSGKCPEGNGLSFGFMNQTIAKKATEQSKFRFEILLKNILKKKLLYLIKQLVDVQKDAQIVI